MACDIYEGPPLYIPKGQVKGFETEKYVFSSQNSVDIQIPPEKILDLTDLQLDLGNVCTLTFFK